MLVISNATKSYDGKKQAIQSIDLTLQPGDMLGFVGHNGAGKTTLIKAIAGIHELNQGTINLFGHDVAKDPLKVKQQIAYIPDHPDLYESLTGQQFIHFIADIYGVPADHRVQHIRELAQRFDMEIALKQPIQTYSHGMKQKAALIAALIHQPKLLLLDEPFVGLDPKAAFTLKEMFKELTQQGSMILFSSHVLEVVEKITNRIAIIKQGKIIAQGETKTIVKDKNLEALFLESL
jgi:ABC-2 type transport system ATP-binding protein